MYLNQEGASSAESKRQTATKTSIKDITFGKYVQEEGWTPNYILTETGKKITRVNIIASVVAKSSDMNYHTLNIDDSTAEISIRSFESNFDEYKVGDIINIIGKPRQFGNEKYLMPEIIKKITDIGWIAIRKKELNINNIKNNTEIKEDIIEDSPSDNIINTIKRLEQDDGADVQAVINELGPESDKLISRLLESGEIFETRPGKIKVLD